MENKEINIMEEVSEPMANRKGNSKKKKIGFIIGIVIMLLILGCICFIIIKSKDNSTNEIDIQNDNKYLSYRLDSNSLEDFDLYFLKLENTENNKLYSPLSIKYALTMLNEGANGNSKKQISDIIGTYTAKKYTNSSNMSFANALFIKDSFKNSIKETYNSTLSNKYNAEVIYDSFNTPDILNSWVKKKTFDLVENIADNIKNNNFILVNALAIDMEWVNKIQSENGNRIIKYDHEDFTRNFAGLVLTDYHGLDFNGFSKKAKSVSIGVAVNKYDIVNVLGEKSIRENVAEKYQDWLNSEDYENESCTPGEDKDVETYVNEYIEEISKNYNRIDSSTDFMFYDNDDVKVFAKDLKKYDNITLQYIGIMPKKVDLDDYINNITADTINNLINSLKPIELTSFKDGIITEIFGYIPMFQFDYELKLMDDLSKLGITDIFDSEKADLSNLSSAKSYIDKAVHKANIEFSNEGIKAAAATALGGLGAGNCGFDYLYEVPVEKIDLTFDNPYMFIIRDKDSGEVWFAGTVYEPVEFQPGE